MNAALNLTCSRGAFVSGQRQPGGAGLRDKTQVISSRKDHGRKVKEVCCNRATRLHWTLGKSAGCGVRCCLVERSVFPTVTKTLK